MSTTYVTLTDAITGRVATVPVYDVADTLHPWYPDAPAALADTIDDLQDALQACGDAGRGDEWRGLAAALCLDVAMGPRPRAEAATLHALVAARVLDNDAQTAQRILAALDDDALRELSLGVGRLVADVWIERAQRAARDRRAAR